MNKKDKEKKDFLLENMLRDARERDIKNIGYKIRPLFNSNSPTGKTVKRKKVAVG